MTVIRSKTVPSMYLEELRVKDNPQFSLHLSYQTKFFREKGSPTHT